VGGGVGVVGCWGGGVVGGGCWGGGSFRCVGWFCFLVFRGGVGVVLWVVLYPTLDRVDLSRCCF